MADIQCSAIVHWQDGVVLVRESEKAKWRLPTKTLSDDEGPILCIRRCVITETGYRAQILRLFKILTGGTAKNKSVQFVFGCKIEPAQLQEPTCDVQTFTPNEMIKLVDRGLFENQLMMQIITNFKNQVPTPFNEFTD